MTDSFVSQHVALAVFLAILNCATTLAVAFITTRVHRRNGHPHE